MEQTPVQQNTEAKAIKYLALGDSYTKGQSIETAGSFPYQLRDALDKSGRVKVEQLKVIAETGWTTINLKNAINASGITDTFDFVTLLIGVNNQYRGQPIEDYDDEFIELLNRAINFAGGDKNKVAIISIPDYGATPFGSADAERIGREIDQYNAISKLIADTMHIVYFDITPISRQAAADQTLTATDGLHPSAKMYKLWVDLMYKDVLDRLK